MYPNNPTLNHVGAQPGYLEAALEARSRSSPTSPVMPIVLVISLRLRPVYQDSEQHVAMHWS